MDWFTKFWKAPVATVATVSTVTTDEINIPKVINVMLDEVNPEEITIENAYKTRWIWYHTILAIGVFMTNILLVAMLLLLAIKL